jgi:hypothetical protein
LSDFESHPVLPATKTGQLGSQQKLFDIPLPKPHSMLPSKVTLSDTVKFQSSSRRKISDSEPVSATESVGVGSSSRRVMSDAKVPNVSMTAGQRNFSDTPDDITNERIAVEMIGTGIPNSPAVQPTTFQDIRRNASSSRRNAKANQQGISSVPKFVDPEAFRVPAQSAQSVPQTAQEVPQSVQTIPQTVDGNQTPNFRKFQNASTRRHFSGGTMVQDEEGKPWIEIDTSEMESSNGVTSRTLSDNDESVYEEVQKSVAQKENSSDNAEATISLPSANVNQPIGFDPLRSAFASHTIGDPYIMSRSLAPDYRPDAMQKLKTWRSPNLKHKPLYFEDAALERQGQSLPKMQPVLSAARFYSSVLLLPQKALVTPPTECVYPLGHGRPGDCAPRVREKNPRRGE